jgi:hypothetical protein
MASSGYRPVTPLYVADPTGDKVADPVTAVTWQTAHEQGKQVIDECHLRVLPE